MAIKINIDELSDNQLKHVEQFLKNVIGYTEYARSVIDEREGEHFLFNSMTTEIIKLKKVLEMQ
jgi:precorrin-3B methylase